MVPALRVPWGARGSVRALLAERAMSDPSFGGRVFTLPFPLVRPLSRLPFPYTTLWKRFCEEKKSIFLCNDCTLSGIVPT